MLRVSPPPGASRPGGKWACSRLRTGRRPGLSPTSRRMPPNPIPAPMLRKEFELRGEVQSARAYVTSLGLYEL